MPVPFQPTVCRASHVWLIFDSRRAAKQVLVSIKADLYELGAPDVTGFPGVDTDEARLIVAAFGKDGPPVAAKRLTVKGRQFPVTVELTVDDLAFPLTKARGSGIEPYIFA